MGKLDRLREQGGANVIESARPPGPGTYPAGMDPSRVSRAPANLQGLTRDKGAARIPLDRIAPDPDQPREEFDHDALSRLAESLRTRGQLQPIRVRWDEGRGVYVVLVGERRWRAARMAGLADLSCVIHDGPLDADERLMVQLVENALREDLRPVEQGKAYRALMASKSWSAAQLAKEMSLDRSGVVRALALLDLPAEVQVRVDRGDLRATTAYEISKLSEPEAQSLVADQVIREGLTGSDVVRAVRTMNANRPAPAAKPAPETFEVDGFVVTVKWKKANGQSAAQGLRKALKLAQARETDAA